MKLFVWDFHGVLEKDTEYGVVSVSNKVLEANGYSERFTFDEVKSLYGRHWWEYFSHLLPGKSHDEHMRLQEECFIIGSTRESILSHTKPNNYVSLVLEKIISNGDEQILISNCNAEALPFFLEAACVTKYFANAFPVDAHRDARRTKAQVLTEFLAGKTYDEVITIGDSLGDVALKKVAEGLGFNSTSYLYSHPDVPFRDCEADYKIHDLRDIKVKSLRQMFSVHRNKIFDDIKKVCGKWTEMDQLREDMERNDDY